MSERDLYRRASALPNAFGQPGGSPGGGRAWMDALRVTRVSAVLSPERPWTLPPTPEVAVRQALERALLSRLCVRQDRNCRGCLQASSCLLTEWFDPGRKGGFELPPFVLRLDTREPVVSPWAPLALDLVLLGSVPRPDLLLKALGELKIGPVAERIEHDLVQVVVRGDRSAAVVERGRPLHQWPAPGRMRSMVRSLPEGVPVLRFVTPLRLGRKVRPSPRAVLRAAEQRVREVAQAQGVTIGPWEGLMAVHGQWESSWCSSPSSGWMGALRLSGPVREIQDLLAAIELLHVGEAVSEGFGRMILEAG